MFSGSLKRPLSLDASSNKFSKRMRFDERPKIYCRPKYEELSTKEKEINTINEIRALHKRESPPTKATSEQKSAKVKSEKSGKKLFTFDQVVQICQKNFQEREMEIREEYNEVLKVKLAEQYEQYVKFTHDQIQDYNKAKNYYTS